jgi:hypothetical protein
MPETRYARSGDISIAYQVVSEGPFDVVLAPSWVTHVELQWEIPRMAAFLRGGAVKLAGLTVTEATTSRLASPALEVPMLLSGNCAGWGQTEADPPLELPPGSVDQPSGGVHSSWPQPSARRETETPAGADAVHARVALLCGPEEQVLVLHPGTLTRRELGVAGVE